jgi:hypothetical protein
MSILLSSFKKSKEVIKKIPDSCHYSVSRWQPSGFSYNILDFLGAYYKNGNGLLLQNRTNPLQSYQHDLFKYYVSRWEEIVLWLTTIQNSDKLIVLNCWCPYSKATKNQIKNFGSFACHTGLIGKIINSYFPDIELYLDKDRHQMLVPEWKPKNYKLMEI